MTSSLTSSSTPSNLPFPSGTGRYAPSPSGDLHLGNLRTAILAWAMARRGAKPFYLRVEDLDRVRPGAAERQIADLAALGLDWDASPGAPTEHIEGSESTEGKEAGVLYQSTPMSRRLRSCARQTSSMSASVPAAKFRRLRVPPTVRRAHTRGPAAS